VKLSKALQMIQAPSNPELLEKLIVS